MGTARSLSSGRPLRAGPVGAFATLQAATSRALRYRERTPICLRAMSARPNMKHEQLALFEPPAPPAMPAGFRYAPELIDAAEEARLVGAFADLPFKEFEFHGFLGKRRVVSFGLRYDFNGGGLREAAPIPPFVLLCASAPPHSRGFHPIAWGTF